MLRHACRPIFLYQRAICAPRAKPLLPLISPVQLCHPPGCQDGPYANCSEHRLPRNTGTSVIRKYDFETRYPLLETLKITGSLYTVLLMIRHDTRAAANRAAW